MIYRQFYSELGKLLYSIANIDGNITHKEKEKFKEIVRKELVPTESNNDSFGTDAAFYTEFEFDVMEDTIFDAQTAFDSFINFIEDHKTGISAKMISSTRNVAKELADAGYHASNRERKLLEKLNKTLDNLELDRRKNLNHV